MHGNMFLDMQGIPYESNWDLWVNIVALLIISAFLYTMTYIRLRLINKFS